MCRINLGDTPRDREKHGMEHALFSHKSISQKAYGSVLHTGVWRSVRRRGVPEVLVTSYFREILGTTLCLQHGSCSTEPMQPVVGLRQGCSLSPIVFRWVLSDIMETLQRRWRDRGCGLSVAECRLLYVAWADHTWLVVKSPAESHAMIQELRAEARSVGLELRLSKCTWAQVNRCDQSPAEPAPEQVDGRDGPCSRNGMCERAGSPGAYAGRLHATNQHDRRPSLERFPHEGAGAAQQGEPAGQVASSPLGDFPLLRVGKWHETLECGGVSKVQSTPDAHDSRYRPLVPA